MARVKRGVTTRAKHKRILEQAKGYYGRRKNTIRVARQAVEKAGQYAYRDRKVKKRSFRALWIQRINAAVRAEGMTYGQFIHALNLAGITLDRKVLADIAMHEAEAFSAIIAQAKSALEKKAASAFLRHEQRKGVGSDLGAFFFIAPGHESWFEQSRCSNLAGKPPPASRIYLLLPRSNASPAISSSATMTVDLCSSSVTRIPREKLRTVLSE
jgi:large subunit ribosomal protein L20